MKYPAFDKITRYGLLSAGILAIGCIVALHVVFWLEGVSLFAAVLEDSVGMLIFVILLEVSNIVGLFVCLFSYCPHIEITEIGIKLKLGIITLNEMSWEQIKRIEVYPVETRYVPRVFCNFLKEDTESKYFRLRRATYNDSKKKISIVILNEKELEVISRYSRREIVGVDDLES